MSKEESENTGQIMSSNSADYHEVEVKWQRILELKVKLKTLEV